MTKYDFRRQLFALALWYAKQEAKDAIQAKGHRLSQYLPKEITQMARELVAAEPQRYIERAREVIAKELFAA
jgi:hypothetical protein